MSDAKSKVQSLDRAFLLLDIIANAQENLTLKTISQVADLPKPTVYRILSSLEAWGYIEMDDRKGYKLGVKLLQLGAQVQEELDIRKVARPFLKELNNLTKETVFLSVMHKGRGLYIDKLDGQHSVRLVAQVGSLNYLHSTGMGKCLLAGLAKDQVEKIIVKQGLPRLTEKTITEPEMLFNQLAVIKEQGYAIDDMEGEEGVRCVAAPIKDHEGKVVAAISISGPAVRITCEAIENTLKAVLLETAHQISGALGYK